MILVEKNIWVILSLFFILIRNGIFILCKIVNGFVLNIMCIKNLFKMLIYVMFYLLIIYLIKDIKYF